MNLQGEYQILLSSMCKVDAWQTHGSPWVNQPIGLAHPSRPIILGPTNIFYHIKFFYFLF